MEDLTDSVVVLTRENGQFILKDQSGNVLGVYESSRAASRWAFANGVLAVKHEYDLRFER